MLRVTLLGRFSASFGACPIPLRSGSKSQELFVYLLLNRQQAHTREEVASLLWEDADPTRSKAYLRKALWQLRSALVESAGDHAPFPILEVDGEWLRLHPRASVWVDVALIEKAYTESRRTPGASLQPSSAAELQDAVALYTGDLLPDRYQNWCLEARERLKHMYLGMLEKLLDFSEARGEHEAALTYGRSILAHDSTCEHVCRQLMRIHCLRGDRAGAIRQYEQCAETLATELGIAPMRETSELYQCIRNGNGDVRRSVEPPAPTADTLHHVVERLGHLQLVLDEIRRSVEDTLRSGSASGGRL